MCEYDVVGVMSDRIEFIVNINWYSATITNCQIIRKPYAV